MDQCAETHRLSTTGLEACHTELPNFGSASGVSLFNLNIRAYFKTFPCSLVHRMSSFRITALDHSASLPSKVLFCLLKNAVSLVQMFSKAHICSISYRKPQESNVISKFN